MEFSLRMVVIMIILLIVAVVLITLITGWTGSENAMFKGMQEFFSNILSGKTIPTMPKVS